MKIVLSNQLIIQKHFSRPGCSVCEEENIFVLFGVLLDVFQRLEGLTDLISRVEQNTVTVKYKVLVFFDYFLQTSLLNRLSLNHVVFGRMTLHICKLSKIIRNR